MRRSILGLTVLAVLIGCGQKLVIESDTSWDGAIGGTGSSSSYSGTGNRTFDLNGGTTCWTIQKATESGTLRAYAEQKSITGIDRMGDASTTAAFGVVSGCNK